jgi:hypothetical protein
MYARRQLESGRQQRQRIYSLQIHSIHARSTSAIDGKQQGIKTCDNHVSRDIGYFFTGTFCVLTMVAIGPRIRWCGRHVPKITVFSSSIDSSLIVGACLVGAGDLSAQRSPVQGITIEQWIIESVDTELVLKRNRFACCIRAGAIRFPD